MCRKDYLIAVILLSLSIQSTILFVPIQAKAVDFPTKPIQLVVPFAPGGISDIMGRLTSEKSAEYLGQPMVVLNKPGAGSTLGINFVAKAKPDGYTLGIGSNSGLSVLKALDPNLPYDPIKDLTLVCLLVTGPNVILVKTDSPLNTLEKLVDYAKKNPGKLTYGTSGVGTTLHLAGELLQLVAGIQMVHVPYKGAAPSLMALLGGHIDLVFSNYADAVEQIKAGKVIPLAVTSPKRFSELPNIPSIVEKGYPGAVSTFFLGVVGPSGLPKPVVAKLAEYFQKVLASTDIQDKTKGFGFTQAFMGPEEFGKFVQNDMDQMQNLVKRANIKLQ